MKHLKRACFLIAMILGGSAAMAQLKLALSYNTATPVSNSFKEYVSKTSFRGFQASVLYGIKNKLRVGLQVTYNDFYEKFGRQVYKTEEGADISTVLSNTMENIPIIAKAEYSFSNTGWLQPYVGLGAGINIIHYDQFLGEFEYSKYYTKAAFTGDVGVLIPFKKNSPYGFRLSTSYNLSPFNEEGIKTISTWNVQAGVSIPLK